MADTESIMNVLVGQTVTLDGLGPCKLEQVLGGGVTAVVFLGVAPAHPPDTQPIKVAVKVARAEPQWKEALELEWQNLTDLAGPDHHTGYFPRILAPGQREKLQTNLYLRLPDKGWDYVPWYILAEELVSGVGFQDLLLAYPGLRLPEPLALEVARQYADMLMILHQTGLTCADRKLQDLRWQKAYDLALGNRTDLERWRRGESPGHMVVLDWNVTEKATDERRALDLFLFGRLWHRLLLASEPRFQREGGALAAPLAEHPLWEQVSFGTRQILEKLLHPDRGRRYEAAVDLKRDLDACIALWRKEPKELWATARADNAPADERWAAADLLRVLREYWAIEESLPEFPKAWLAARRAYEEAPFRALRMAVAQMEWQQALREVRALAAIYNGDAKRQLWLDRYAVILTAAVDGSPSSETVATFTRLADNLDAPVLTESDMESLGRLAQQWPAAPWAGVVDRLRREALYHTLIREAGRTAALDDVITAAGCFAELLGHRAWLQQYHPRVVEWLDRLYGDPTPESHIVKRHAAAFTDVSELLQQALLAVVQEAPSLERSRGCINDAMHSDPQNTVLMWARRLIEAEETWQRTAPGTRLDHMVFSLSSWAQVLVDLPQHQPPAAVEQPVLARPVGRAQESCRQVAATSAPDLNRLLARRQEELRDRIVIAIREWPGQAVDQKDDVYRDMADGIASLGMAYVRAFNNDVTFRSDVRQIRDDWLSQILPIVQDPLPNSEDALKNRLAELAGWVGRAYAGQAVARALGEAWPEAATAGSIRREIETALDRQAELTAKQHRGKGLLDKLLDRVTPPHNMKGRSSDGQ